MGEDFSTEKVSVSPLFVSLDYCRRFCSCESTRLQQHSIAFNEQPTSGSAAITWKPQNFTSFNNGWNLVRDQGVGGSNPLSPTNIFNHLQQPHLDLLGMAQVVCRCR